MALTPARFGLLLALAGVGCRQSASEADAPLVAALNSDPGHLNPAITSGGGVVPEWCPNAFSTDATSPFRLD